MRKNEELDRSDDEELEKEVDRHMEMIAQEIHEQNKRKEMFNRIWDKIDNERRKK